TIYQELNGARQPVDGEFRLQNSECTRSTDYCLPTTVYFSLGPYDPTRPLVIDPVLSYSTYLGGSSGDTAYAVAADASGSAYVAGTTLSLNFPLVNPFQSSYGGGAGDAFVAKLSPNGSALIYATYLGGPILSTVTMSLWTPRDRPT